jgi:hemerythrin-like domain-containing protein
MIVDFLRQEHRNIEKLLLVLEQELALFARGVRRDYEVIRAVVAYFEISVIIETHTRQYPIRRDGTV